MEMTWKCVIKMKETTHDESIAQCNVMMRMRGNAPVTHHGRGTEQ